MKRSEFVNICLLKSIESLQKGNLFVVFPSVKYHFDNFFFSHHGQIYYQHVSSNFAIDSLFLDEIRVHYSNESYDRLKLTFRISFLLVTEQKVFELSKTIYNFQEGPSISWAHPCPGSIYPEGPLGPSMPRAHPCPAPIHPRGPMVDYPCPDPIHTEGPCLPGVQHAEEPCNPIPPQGPSYTGGSWAHSCPVPIHAEGPFLLRAYSS